MDGECSIRVLRGVDEARSIQESWRALQWHAHGDFDYFLARALRAGGKMRPHVLVLERARTGASLAEDGFVSQ